MREKIVRKLLRVLLSLCLLFIATSPTLLAQQAPADPVLGAMSKELNRSMRNFKNVAVPPYFLSYQLTDNRAVNIVASFGTLTSTSDLNTRVLDLDLHVGDYKLDSTHPLREDTSSDEMMDRLDTPKMPLDDDPMSLRVALWQATEQRYRRAVERLQQVQANVQVKVEAEDTSGDFSHEEAETYSEPIAPF